MPNLAQHFVHLGPGATAIAQPDFTDGAWYEGYGARHDSEGADCRLVSQFTFTESWDSWEMHPSGDEVVFLMRGEVVLHQELADGTKAEMRLVAGEYGINPPGAWHTMDLVSAEASVLFITAGLGTEHRPR
jgi:hypothetical protein